MKLDAGTSRSLDVLAREKRNGTGIEVATGERYAFRAKGEWTDLSIRCGPDGYATRDAPLLSRWFLTLFERRRRLRAENWFVLAGVVGSDDTAAFRIGGRLDDWRPNASGELLCFANDVPSAYFNNRGSITLTVTRTE